jgi:hypothetical protein
MEQVARINVLERSSVYRSFTDELDPQLRIVDRELAVESVSLSIWFSKSPTATALARSLDETDRQARRVVAGFQRGVRPESLRGRGVRLVPPALGLVVERADPGSLDLLLGLGGLYQTITSQPLAFALNLAALLGYGKATLRALDPRAKPTKEITVKLPVVPNADHEQYDPDRRIPRLPPHTASLNVAEAKIPSDYTRVHVHVTMPDGTAIDIDCSK